MLISGPPKGTKNPAKKTKQVANYVNLEYIKNFDWLPSIVQTAVNWHFVDLLVSVTLTEGTKFKINK